MTFCSRRNCILIDQYEQPYPKTNIQLVPFKSLLLDLSLDSCPQTNAFADLALRLHCNTTQPTAKICLFILQFITQLRQCGLLSGSSQETYMGGLLTLGLAYLQTKTVQVSFKTGTKRNYACASKNVYHDAL